MTASPDSFSAPASASSPVAPPSPDPRACGQRLFIQRRHIQEAFIGPDPDARAEAVDDVRNWADRMTAHLPLKRVTFTDAEALART